MSRRFSVTAKEIGKSDVTAHIMRHTFISRLVANHHIIRALEALVSPPPSLAPPLQSISHWGLH